jgi:hypothetical protein
MLLIYLIQSSFPLASFLAGVRSYRKLPQSDVFYLTLYSFVSFMMTILTVFFIPESYRALHINLFTLFEYYLFAFLITKTVGFNLIKLPLIILTVIFTSFAIFSMFKASWTQQMRSDVITIENICLTILTLSYFKNVLKNIENVDLKNDFLFWSITGASFYFCLTTPYYILYATLTIKHVRILYFINGVLNSLMHCFFIKGFLCRIKGK